MILDYNYSQLEKELSISYIDNSGNKQIMKFNGLTKIPTYYFSPNGQFTNWDGSKCSKKLTSKPSVFDIKEFIFNLSPEYQKKLENKVFPKLYTFDIETQIKSKYEFTEPTVADMPILTISMVNPELNCVVLGTKSLTENDENELQQKFVNYLNNIDFYKKLKIDTPKIRYIKFDSEELMIKYFLEKIVAKVPIIAGWNSIGYDWCYFVHRIKNFYPKLSIKLSSITNGISYKNYTNKKNETIKLPHPNHTLVLDMMDIIDEHDKTGIMPAKESMNLDYVASQTLGANKIEYDGDLQTLYETDYQKYVFYNAIDSILVQLLDKRFKIMHQFYLMSLFCKESIGKCFSKISLTEALVFKYYFENNIKIVPEHKDDIERGNLVGAYVKEPKPGKWNWMCCNDFASLYPSSIITCNLSFDNFLGKLGREFTQEQIDKFKKNKNYFVSVNNCVYKNDKDYTFKIIEKSLKSQRDKDKYLAKAIDATLCRDLKHFLHNQPIDIVEYPNNVREYFKGFGYDIVDANSFKDIQNIDEFLMLVENESTYLFGMEQAVKEMMNSMYGGSSNVSFYWFNMDFANDITGESRWLIHKMEEHIPEHFNKEWLNLKDVHKKLGIEVDENLVKEMLKNKEDIVTLVYGDSCSGDTVISLKDNEKTIESLFNECSVVFEDRGKEFGITDKYILNFNGKELVYNKIKWVIRHKTNKSKWQIHTKNNTIEVTGDHSCIIWKNNKMVELSPKDMNIGDLVINSNGDFERITSVECVGNYDSEYVYDIEVDTLNTNEHNFFGNGILIHNTDSVDGSSIITTDNGNKTIEELFKENEHNNKLITHKGHELVPVKDKILNYNDKDELEFQNAKYIMRHKVSKPKWRLKTKSGKEIFVTNDHSMIVFRDGKKLEVKPYEILKTDKILVVK